MSILNTETQKLKKIVVAFEETIADEFTFVESDITLWAEDQSTLYIFTIGCQFY